MDARCIYAAYGRVFLVICIHTSRLFVSILSNRVYRVDSVTNVRAENMTDRNIVKPRRKRLDDPSGSRSNSERSDRPKEPARPPRTRTQQVANVTATNNSDFGNVMQRSTFAEVHQRQS